MEKSEIMSKIEQFIHTNFIFDENLALAKDQSLLDSGVIDSTGVLELVNFLEETFGFTVNDEELVPDNLDSINNITAFVQKKRA
jgi:acyl carrier protein